MRVFLTVNGKKLMLEVSDMTLNGVLLAMDINPNGRIISCNDQLFRPEEFSQLVKDGDVIEIIQFLGGG